MNWNMLVRSCFDIATESTSNNITAETLLPWVFFPNSKDFPRIFIASRAQQRGWQGFAGCTGHTRPLLVHMRSPFERHEGSLDSAYGAYKVPSTGKSRNIESALKLRQRLTWGD